MTASRALQTVDDCTKPRIAVPVDGPAMRGGLRPLFRTGETTRTADWSGTTGLSASPLRRKRRQMRSGNRFPDGEIHM